MEKPEKQPDNQQMDPVSRFKRDYAEALAEAQAQAEMTATAGWQGLYSGARKSDRDGRRELAERMRSLADEAENHGLTEDGEKAVGECKKTSMELRDAREHFDRRVVGPVKAAAEACATCINNARRDARAEEEKHPLHNVGLEELMRAAIGEVPAVEWDAESGRVLIE